MSTQQPSEQRTPAAEAELPAAKRARLSVDAPTSTQPLQPVTDAALVEAALKEVHERCGVRLELGARLEARWLYEKDDDDDAAAAAEPGGAAGEAAAPSGLLWCPATLAHLLPDRDPLHSLPQWSLAYDAVAGGHPAVTHTVAFYGRGLLLDYGAQPDASADAASPPPPAGGTPASGGSGAKAASPSPGGAEEEEEEEEEDGPDIVDWRLAGDTHDPPALIEAPARVEVRLEEGGPSELCLLVGEITPAGCYPVLRAREITAAAEHMLAEAEAAATLVPRERVRPLTTVTPAEAAAAGGGGGRSGADAAAALAADEAAPVVEMVQGTPVDFVDAIVRRMLVGPLFSRLDATRQRQMADVCARLRPIFEETIQEYVAGKEPGFVFSMEDVSQVLPRILLRARERGIGLPGPA